MKKQLLGITIGLVCTTAIFAQNYQWVRQFGGTGDESAKAITQDNQGNIYMTGYFSGTVDFDPGPASYQLTASGLNDVFVTKLDPYGTFLWAFKIGGTSGNNSGNGIAADNAGNIYVTGHFKRSADFDPGAGNQTITSTLAGLSYTEDIFVAKYTDAGAYVWVQQIGDDGDDQGNAIALDRSGKPVITGKFSGTVDFRPGSGTYWLGSMGSNDAYVLKLNTSGGFVFAAQLGGSQPEWGYAIATDTAGNIYSAGYFGGTADFDPGVGTQNRNAAGYFDCYISKLDSSGNYVSAICFGGPDLETAYGLKADNAGNMYVTGLFNTTADFDPTAGVYNISSVGMQDIFICKYDAAGNLSWMKQFGGMGEEEGYALTIDSSGNVYTSGFFQGSVDFDPGMGSNLLTAAGGRDVYISCLDSAGNYIWGKAVGGNADDQPAAITANDNGDVFITGSFSSNASSCDFDPGSGAAIVNAIGLKDIFLLKLGTGFNVIPNALSDNETELFPNPASDLINLYFGNNADQAIVRMFNPQGQLVLEKRFSNVLSGTAIQLEISSLANEMYIVQTDLDGKLMNRKIVIQH